MLYEIMHTCHLCIIDSLFKLGIVKKAYEETCIIFSIILTYFSN